MGEEEEEEERSLGGLRGRLVQKLLNGAHEGLEAAFTQGPEHALSSDHLQLDSRGLDSYTMGLEWVVDLVLTPVNAGVDSRQPVLTKNDIVGLEVCDDEGTRGEVGGEGEIGIFQL